MFSFRIPVDEVIMIRREVRLIARDIPKSIPIIICMRFFDGLNLRRLLLVCCHLFYI